MPTTSAQRFKTKRLPKERSRFFPHFQRPTPCLVEELCDIMADNGSGTPPPGSSASERAKLRMRLFSSNEAATDAPPSNIDSDDSSVNSNNTATPPHRGDVANYNHFTTPLTPSTTNTSITTTHNSITDQHNQQQKQQSVFSDLERSHTVDKFINILTNQLSLALSSGKLTQAWKPPNNNATNDDDNTVVDYYYDMERRIIMPHITPFIWGGSALIITLFSLRFGRWYQSYSTMKNSSSSSSSSSSLLFSSTADSVGGIGNMIRRYIIDGSSNSKYSHHSNQRNIQQQQLQQQQQQQHGMNTTSSSSIQDVRQHQSLIESMKHNNNDTAGRGEDVFQSIGSLLVDISLSILFGISTTLFLIDRYQLLQDVASLPLRILNNDNDDNETKTIITSINSSSSSGGSRHVNKSVIVEELCIPFSNEMDKINTSSILVRNTPPHRQDHEVEEVDNDDDEGTTEVSYSELWKDENLNDYITLRSIRDFVANCHIYEKLKKRDREDV